VLTLMHHSFQIRIHALVCVGKLVPSFDKWFVQDEVLPFLEKIACKEPGVLMGILGVYKTVLDSDKIGKKSAGSFSTCSALEALLFQWIFWNK